MKLIQNTTQIIAIFAVLLLSATSSTAAQSSNRRRKLQTRRNPIALGGPNQFSRQISQDKVDRMMTSLCPRWPGIQKYSCGSNLPCGNGGRDNVQVLACPNSKVQSTWTPIGSVFPTCINDRRNQMRFRFKSNRDGVVQFICNANIRQPCIVTGVNC